MNPIIEYLTGMDALTDQIVAMDLLNSVKRSQKLCDGGDGSRNA